MAVPTVARTYHHPGAAAHGIPGHAGRIVASLGGNIDVRELTDDVGALTLGDVADGDLREIHALLRVVLGVDGPVLDLAVGAGRLSVPLLSLGRRVTALDRSEAVLDAVRRRVALGPARLRSSFEVVRADPWTYTLEAGFGAIVVASPTLGSYEPAARASMFACARRHLLPEGRLVVSAVDHGGDDLPVEVERVVVAPSGRVFRVHEYWEPGSPTWRLTVLPIEQGAEDVVVCTSRLRVVTVATVIRELRAAGFDVVARHRVTDAGPRHPQVLVEAARSEGPRDRMEELLGERG
jgi:methylation protein MtfA